MPEGPIRLFYERLHELHAAAGWPSMRQIQRDSRTQRRPRGINPTTVHDAFTAPRLARWEIVEEIVTQLGGDIAEFERLWRRAWEAQALGAGPTDLGERHGRTADADVRGMAGTPVPRELPPDVFAFTGRADQLKWLDELLPGTANAVVVAAITGTAGVGKTSLAVHWAQSVRDRFPDGQLYVNLRGYSQGPPMRPMGALTHFLRSLGVPAQAIPEGQEAATARYRSLLANRRVLVLLDNAVDPAQIRPLLPGGPGCLVLVTSRDRLSGLVALDGARRLSLEVLGADEAQSLLGRILGVERVAVETEDAAALARSCAYLPLALRLAAAALSDHPARRLADFNEALRRDRIAMLDVAGDDQSGVRSAFDLSYRAVSADGQRLFRLAGLVPGPDLTAGAAAALIDATAEYAGGLLDRLASAHLLTQHAPGRYACHDLLRSYAADHARLEESDADRKRALERLFEWYLRGADSAARLVYPHNLRLSVPPTATAGPAFDDYASALAWLDDERANLLAAIGHAADHGPRRFAWLLADAMRSYFWLRLHTLDLVHATDAALRAAEADGDLRAQAVTLLSLGNVHHRYRRYEEAITHTSRALDLTEEAGWGAGKAAALGSLATAYRDAGRMDRSAEVFDRALAAYRDEGSVTGEALTLTHLARTYWYLGRIPDALASASAAVELYQRVGRRGDPHALGTLGEVCHAGGLLDEALEHLGRALILARDTGDRGAEASALRDLAKVRRDLGQVHRALELAQQAVLMAREAGDIRIKAESLNTLGTVHLRLGQHHEAAASHREVLDLIAPSGDPSPEIQAHLGLAAAYHGLDLVEESLDHAHDALATARRTGFPILEEQSLAMLRQLGQRP